MNLHDVADVCTILTLIAGVSAWCNYRYAVRRKRIILEEYLELEKGRALKGQPDSYAKRSVKHLTAKLGLTEGEILQASFSSRKIARTTQANPSTGLAGELLLEYVANPN